jgi:thiol-disulfide isomerase/thioredoxin
MMERRRTAGRALFGLLLVASLAVPDRVAAADSFKPFRLKALDGVEKSLSDVLGKATLVVFFFPTCIFCNAAFPSIQRLHDTYKDQGLSMVWINVVAEEERLIAAWQMKNGYTVPVLLGGRSVQRDYKLTMTPTYYLLDSGANVLSRHAGYKLGDETGLVRDIRQALAHDQ